MKQLREAGVELPAAEALAPATVDAGRQPEEFGAAFLARDGEAAEHSARNARVEKLVGGGSGQGAAVPTVLTEVLGGGATSSTASVGEKPRQERLLGLLFDLLDSPEKQGASAASLPVPTAPASLATTSPALGRTAEDGRLVALVISKLLSDSSSANAEVRNLLEDLLAAGTAGAAGLAGARGVKGKEKQDQDFFLHPQRWADDYRSRILRLMKVRPGQHFRLSDYKSRIPFGNYRTLERAWTVAEEIAEALHDKNWALAAGLNAAWMMTLEEVALGSDWDLAWTALPFVDPTAATVVGSLDTTRMSTGIAYLRDVQWVMERRRKGGFVKPEDRRRETPAEVDQASAQKGESNKKKKGK